jgi:alpha-tubulin suppressor-like RCC1 family protein
VPVQVPGLSAVTAISAGNNYSLALRSDGTVMAWGDNRFGQLGNGGTENSSVPAQVPGLSEVTGISAGMRIALAVLRDGRVMVWGYNGPLTQGGELGIGTPVGPETCGFVFCSTNPMPVVDLTEAVAVAGGHSHNLALLRDGTVVGWGGNSYGQLGNGREPMLSGKNRSYVPVQARGVTGATAVSAGSKYSMALLRDGTVMAWGKNFYGELGMGDEMTRRVPTPVPNLSGVVAIGAGGGREKGAGHSLALLSNGTVMAWGGNSEGELGIGTTTDTPVPTPVSGLKGASGISSGAFHSLAIR